MEKLKDRLKNEYGNMFSYGVIPQLHFEADDEHTRILLVGGEHGDKTAGTGAMLHLAKRLKESPLESTTVDMVPVLDTTGYPTTRTSLGGGFGHETHMDTAYLADDKPEQVTALLSMMGKGKYDLAMLLTENFVEEAPGLQGYFMFYQINTKVGEGAPKVEFLFPETKDLGGTILNKLQAEEVPLLSPKNINLGDGHVVIAPGVVFQGFHEQDNLVFRTRNQFAYACQERNIPALVLMAPSSSMGGDYNAKGAHMHALEETVRFYESIKD